MTYRSPWARVLCTSIWLMAPAIDLSSARAIVLTASPRTAFEPAGLQIRLTIERHAENRSVSLTLDDGVGYFRDSRWQLDGEDSPRTHWIRWPRIPAGEFQLTAVVWTGTGKARAADTLAITRLSLLQ